MSFHETLWENIMFFELFFNRIIIAFALFVIGLILGRIAGNFVKRVLHEVELNVMLKRTANIKSDVEDRAGRIVSWVIYFFAGLIALNQLGWANTVATLVSAAVLVVIIIGFLLAVKDYIPNLIAGYHILHKKLYQEGDTIETGDVAGVVKKIGLVETEVESNGDRLFLPNSTIMKGTLKVKR